VNALNGQTLPSALLIVITTILAVRASGAISKIPKIFNIGRFSYSLYVFHYQFIVLVAFGVLAPLGLFEPIRRSYLGWIIFLPAILLPCWLLYLAVEKPCNAYLAVLRARQKAKRAAEQATA
jgi:peptidoglycan/LPS O-acetylase OafA/YrhL